MVPGEIPGQSYLDGLNLFETKARPLGAGLKKEQDKLLTTFSLSETIKLGFADLK